MKWKVVELEHPCRAVRCERAASRQPHPRNQPYGVTTDICCRRNTKSSGFYESDCSDDALCESTKSCFLPLNPNGEDGSYMREQVHFVCQLHGLPCHTCMTSATSLTRVMARITDSNEATASSNVDGNSRGCPRHASVVDPDTPHVGFQTKDCMKRNRSCPCRVFTILTRVTIVMTKRQMGDTTDD